MSSRITFALIAFLALAGGALFLDGYNPRTVQPPADAPSTEGEPAKPLLLEVDAVEVERVVLRSNGTQRVSLRQGDSWSGPAPGMVAEFLKDVSTLRLLTELDARPDEFQQFGLDPPRGVVELEIKGKNKGMVLEIGTRNPTTTGVYVRLPGGRVGVAGALIEWEFQRLFQKLVTDHAV